jgi:hypothetical protein
MEEASLQEIPRRKKRDRKVKHMRQNSILIAGLFIACILSAGIPAVAAAENPAIQDPLKAPAPAPTATQAAQPVVPQPTMQSAGQAPWYTPITSVLGFHEQSEQNTQENGAADDQKLWWENIWPLKDTRETTPQVTPAQDQQPATQITPQDNAGQQQNNNQKEKTNQNMNPEKKPVPANP